MRNPATSVGAGGGTTASCSKGGLKRGPWTAEEDELLSNYMSKDGGEAAKWRTLPKRAGLLRCGKSCRLRWMNYLRPSVKRGRISSDEEDLILRLHRLLGNRWSLIAGRIPGRTDNEIKNYWNTHLSKKLISQGIDPRTHKQLIHHDVQVQLSGNTKHKINHKKPPNPIPTRSKESNSTQSDQPLLHINTTTAGSSFDYSTSIASFQPNPNPNGLNNNASGLISNGSQEDHLEDDPGYCTDEVFSSFLNSIIDEELFTCQNQQDQQLPNLDALIAHPSATNLHHNPPDDQPQ